MIVADINLIAYFLFKGQFSEEANTVHVLDPVWTSPHLWRSEFLNVIVAHIRARLISTEDGLRVYELSKRLIGEREFSVSPVDVIELSAQSGCSSYDCEFVALAREFGIKLVSYNKKVLSAFPGIAISASEFIRINKK